MARRRLAGAALAAGLLVGAAPAGAVDLAGTWYVLVHYQDADSNNPEAWRWEDRVWRFRPDGDRLEWTEWPIVVFEDESGRFESTGRRTARVVAAWEPSPAQLADLRDGLQVNSRGSKTKTLASSDGGASWASSGGPAAESAAVLTYSEVLRIESADGLPIFVREDSLGGASAESMEGRTEYRTEEIGEDEIRGSFRRDGSRTGRFRMWRSSASSGVRTASKTQEELQRKAAVRALVSSDEMRELVRERMAESLGEAGVSLSDEELDALVAEAAQAMARGQSPDQIAPALAVRAQEAFFSFARPGATHDDSVRYRWPFDPKTPRRLAQGPGGGVAIDLYGNVSTPTFSHEGSSHYAYDFEMPVGTPVLAARAGRVVRVVDGFTRGGPNQSLAAQANVVVVEHEDGSFASYVHLSPGARVEPGQAVAAGDEIGRSGNTGFTTGPHLHFEVQRLSEDGEREPIDIRFDDGSGPGLVPVTGSYYGAGSAGGRSPEGD